MWVGEQNGHIYRIMIFLTWEAKSYIKVVKIGTLIYGLRYNYLTNRVFNELLNTQLIYVCSE
jgi:hypothetical protein